MITFSDIFGLNIVSGTIFMSFTRIGICFSITISKLYLCHFCETASRKTFEKINEIKADFHHFFLTTLLAL